MNFNSHTHVEYDGTILTMGAAHTIFQLTHSRGVRPFSALACRIVYHFNSHTHVEYDLEMGAQEQKQANFNSHTHVEYDFCSGWITATQQNFNSHTHVEYDVC